MEKTVCRICLVTRKPCDRRLLFRVVRTPEGKVLIESTSHLPGRGAYLTRDKAVIEKARKGNLLKRALRCDIPEEIYQELLVSAEKK